jgi:hypothetical protein
MDQFHDAFAMMGHWSGRLESQYRLIRRSSKADPGSAGDQAEQDWAEILRFWLPSYYHVRTKGRILGYNNECSPQIDVVVLHPSYPQGLLDSKLYYAAGVAAAFECKLTLERRHIRKAMQNSAAIKHLLPRRQGTPFRDLHSQVFYGMLAHSHSWKGKKSEPEKIIDAALSQYDEEFASHPRECLDLLCVADLKTWVMSKDVNIAALSGSNEKTDLPQWMDVTSGFVKLNTECFVGKPDFVTEDGQNLIRYPVNARKQLVPVSAALFTLYDKMAWNDHRMRDLAQYLTHIGMGSMGGGRLRSWPLTVFSKETLDRAAEVDLDRKTLWDEWGYGFS